MSDVSPDHLNHGGSKKRVSHSLGGKRGFPSRLERISNKKGEKVGEERVLLSEGLRGLSEGLSVVDTGNLRAVGRAKEGVLKAEGLKGQLSFLRIEEFLQEREKGYGSEEGDWEARQFGLGEEGMGVRELAGEFWDQRLWGELLKVER
ncbi:hypothetical protein DY000_02012057 [Brassica cretica]|uniref:Uncharacterized protein n=1 Tax=Brassica cretica TaxID=69181 RepID=A0ABQ7D0K4_BRACR|nr:hypothetical protein DY000_02012057 [Brassica cretica]